MQLKRTLLISDRENLSQTLRWQSVYRDISLSVSKIVHPEGSKHLIIRKKVPSQKQFGIKEQRNGVVPLKNAFLRNIKKCGWSAEYSFPALTEEDQVCTPLYPDGTPYKEPIRSRFGGFDFMAEREGFRCAIEWETGNISSSHRSLNKLVVALNKKVVDAGVLVVPSRALYENLTDRVGNIDELSGYFTGWQSGVNRGLLAICVVEHDQLTEDEGVPFLPSGRDGNAYKG